MSLTIILGRDAKVLIDKTAEMYIIAEMGFGLSSDSIILRNNTKDSTLPDKIEISVDKVSSIFLSNSKNQIKTMNIKKQMELHLKAVSVLNSILSCDDMIKEATWGDTAYEIREDSVKQYASTLEQIVRPVINNMHIPIAEIMEKSEQELRNGHEHLLVKLG